MKVCSRAWMALIYVLLATAGAFANNNLDKDERLTGRSLAARVNFKQEVGLNNVDGFMDDDVEAAADGGAMDDVNEFAGMDEDIDDDLVGSLTDKLRQHDDINNGIHEIDQEFGNIDVSEQNWEAVRREWGKEARRGGARAGGEQDFLAAGAGLDGELVNHNDPDTLRSIVEKQEQQKAINTNNNNIDIPLPTDTPTAVNSASTTTAKTAAGFQTQTTTTTTTTLNTKTNPFNLPSFESTPLPPKLSFRDWQSRYQSARHDDIQQHLARIRGEIPDDALHPSVSSPHAYEFTSREGLGYGAPPQNYLAVCMVVRDAHDDIAEWVHYHQKLGISKFYIYDHESTPPLSRVLKPWIDQGVVIYQALTPADYSRHPSGRPQLYGYDTCLQEHGSKHHWIAFIDVDEFLVFQQGPPVQNLPSFLQRYEEYSAVAVHWILFGSAGRDVRPVRGTLRSYPMAVPRNHTYHLYVKTIANTKCTIRTTDSPHVFQHNCTRPAVRTNFSPIHSQSADDLPVHSILALHHYATRSAEEFEIKMARGSGMKRQRGWEYFYFVDSWSIDYNLAGLQVWDDNVVTLGRTLDPGMLEEQLEKYSKEEHEEFWGKKDGIKDGGNIKNSNNNNAAVSDAEQAGKAAVAATVNQAKVQADHWGREEDYDVEVDEHGGEWDTDLEESLDI